MASPESLQQRQRFLAAVLNTSREPLNAQEKILAKTKFDRIIDRYSRRRRERSSRLLRHLLIQHTYEYALSEESQFHFLQIFFEALELTVAGQVRVNLDDREQADRLWIKISAFADFLVDSFYLPLKAAARRAPLLSLKAQPAVPDHINDPREDCLIRDGHRCIVTRAFDWVEAATRHKQHAGKSKDDEGRPLFCGNQFFHLEAAPIVPHSLAEIGSDPSELNPTKRLMLTILNILHPGVGDLINECVGTTRNAMTLTKNYHHMWSEFDFFFTPQDPPSRPHMYQIADFIPSPMRRELPTTQTFCAEADGKPIAPPEPRLLALRRALAHILYLSRAGIHIDAMLEKLEGRHIAEDETELGLFEQLRLDERRSSPAAAAAAAPAPAPDATPDTTDAAADDDDATVAAVADAVAAIDIAPDADADAAAAAAEH